MTTEVTHQCSDVRWLEFPEPDPNRSDTQATGLRFEGLSRECRGIDEEDVGVYYHDNCCQGRGRVAMDTLEAWLDAADTFGGWALQRFYTQSYIAMQFFSMPPEQHPDDPTGRASTRLEAIQEAICRAMRNHVEMKVA